MKKRSFYFTFTLFLLFSSTASAVNFLQLDISDGVYNPTKSGVVDEETIFATTNPFTLYALINTVNTNPAELSDILSDTYYVSFAVINTSGGLDFGTDVDGWFSIDGTEYSVTENMDYGTPPIATVDSDLQSHGIFETYFIETSFTINQDQRATLYNSQEDSGGLIEDPNGELYYEDFLITYSLPEGYSLHMDLYTVGVTNENSGKTGITNFAPFSHDAQGGGLPPTIPPPPGGGTDPVPEPATMLLLGIGLIGLAGVSRRSRNHLNK